MVRDLTDVTVELTIPWKANGPPLVVYLTAPDGGAIDVKTGFVAARLVLVEYAGGPEILTRTLGGAAGAALTLEDVDGVPAVKADAISAAEFVTLVPGKYLLGVWLQQVTTLLWFATPSVRLNVVDTPGGPTP